MIERVTLLTGKDQPLVRGPGNRAVNMTTSNVMSAAVEPVGMARHAQLDLDHAARREPRFAAPVLSQFDDLVTRLH